MVTHPVVRSKSLVQSRAIIWSGISSGLFSHFTQLITLALSVCVCLEKELSECNGSWKRKPSELKRKWINTCIKHKRGQLFSRLQTVCLRVSMCSSFVLPGSRVQALQTQRRPCINSSSVRSHPATYARSSKVQLYHILEYSVVFYCALIS